MSGWWVYVLRCRDGSLYTGITRDLDARVEAHGRGVASKYTRSRRPVTLVWCEPRDARPDAARREAEIKRLPREAKLALVAEGATLTRPPRAGPSPDR